MSRSKSRNGMDWILLERRLAIYHRDSFDCVWCASVFPPDPLGYGLCLDHVEPSNGNGSGNLITACNDCNATKRDLSAEEWAAELQRRGVDPAAAFDRVRAQLALPLDMDEGRRLALERRPNHKGTRERCLKAAGAA